MRIRSDKVHNVDEDRIGVSFRCDRSLWLEFDKFMTERYGNYKKSILVESLIRKYMKQKVRNTGLTVDNKGFVF